MIEGMSQVRTIKVFFTTILDKSLKRWDSHSSKDSWFMVDQKNHFGYSMKTDGVIAHVNHWILKSYGRNDGKTEVQQIVPVYRKAHHMPKINNDKQVLLKANPSKTT